MHDVLTRLNPSPLKCTSAVNYRCYVIVHFGIQINENSQPNYSKLK